MARIGTSGWSYDHWDGVCWPPGTPTRDRLAHYAARFDTVELNASFYRWPRDASFAGWRERLPEGFTLAVKAPRVMTHSKKLLDPESWLPRVTTGLDALGPRRGPFLIQLPPSLQRDDARLDHFLGALPDWFRPAVEFRHESWLHDEVFGLLERRGAAYVVMSGAKLPCVLRRTADDVYVRLHGPDDDHLYAGSYSDADLGWWSDRIGEWESAGARVWAYFNNDGGGNAVRNAQRLKELLA